MKRLGGNLGAWLRAHPVKFVLLFLFLNTCGGLARSAVGGVLGFFLGWFGMAAAIMLGLVWLNGSRYR